MKDRFTRGFFSGLLAGIPALIFALIAVAFKWTTLRWSNFAAIFIYGRKSVNISEEIFSNMAVFLICGILGAVFSFVIPKISSTNYLLKCWLLSVSFWFAAFAVTMLFKVPGLLIIPGKTAMMNFVEATIWGLSFGFCLKWFDNRVKELN